MSFLGIAGPKPGSRRRVVIGWRAKVITKYSYVYETYILHSYPNLLGTKGFAVVIIILN
jgi:hypothetical protein